MVDVHDITRSLHCPNPLACPGGLLSANESKPMCSPGGVKETCGVETTRRHEPPSLACFLIMEMHQ